MRGIWLGALGPIRLALSTPIWLVGGCGLVLEFDGGDPEPVDSGKADVQVDADAATRDAAPIDWDALPPIGPAERVQPISHSSAQDDDPTLTADRLEIYFSSDRAGAAGESNIWRSERATETMPWSTPEPVPELNSADHDDTPEIAGDGLTIWLARGETDFNRKIYVASRPNRESEWSTPTIVSELSTAPAQLNPTPSASLLRMTFARQSSEQPADLFLTERATVSDSWTTPVPMEALNTPDDERAPMLGPWERLIFFASERDGSDRNLYLAQRESQEMPFGTPRPIAALNSTNNEEDPWVSPDLRHIVFASDRESGISNIYQAFRSGS